MNRIFNSIKSDLADQAQAVGPQDRPDPTQGRRPRAAVFIDGQNLFHSAKALFGHRRPNFDVRALADALCGKSGGACSEIYFYSGIPSNKEAPEWNAYWRRKLAAMSREGVKLFTPPLRYSTRREIDANGRQHTVRIPTEKGVDVRIALDIVRAANEATCDTIILVSQDSDLFEAVSEALAIARDQGRLLRLISAFPERESGSGRGIEGSERMGFDRALYDRCIDPRDYWKQPSSEAGITGRTPGN